MIKVIEKSCSKDNDNKHNMKRINECQVNDNTNTMSANKDILMAGEKIYPVV